MMPGHVESEPSAAQIVGVYRNLNEPAWVSELQSQIEPLERSFKLVDTFRVHIASQMEVRQIETPSRKAASEVEAAIYRRIGHTFLHAAGIWLRDEIYISNRSLYVDVAPIPPLPGEREGFFKALKSINKRAFPVPGFTFRLKIGEVKNKHKAEEIQEAVGSCLKEKVWVGRGKIKTV